MKIIKKNYEKIIKKIKKGESKNEKKIIFK